MTKRTIQERSESGDGLTNGKNVSSHTALGIDATRLRAGLAKRTPSASDLPVRVAGAIPGPALGPAALNPASVSFDFPGSFELQEPGTGGLGSRRTRLLADQEAA
jgi:hypothetical protein